MKFEYPLWEQELTLQLLKTRQQYHDIHDTTGYLQGYLNPCFDTKLFGPREGIKYFEFTQLGLPGGSTVKVTIDDDFGLYPEDLGEQLIAAFNPPTEDWYEEFASDAMHYFKSAVVPQVKLLNLIIESVAAIFDMAGSIAKVLALGTKAIKSFRNMFKRTGNYWLAWNFAIKPTLDDIQKILDEQKKSKKRFDWLRKHNHRDTVVSFRRKSVHEELIETPHYWVARELLRNHLPEEPFGLPTIINDSNVDDFRWKLTELEARLTPTVATAIVRFDIPDWVFAWDPSLGYRFVRMGYYGLARPLDTIWEAIPFSWAIDWCFKSITQLWTRLDLGPLPDASVLQTCNSETWTFTGYLSFEYRVNYEWVTVPLGPVGMKVYNRQPGLPQRELSLIRLPFEWYNASILSALIQQKSRR